MNEQKIHYPLIRTIYLYLFALVGLTLLIIGAVRFVDMGLKAFVFTRADEETRLFDKRPPMPRSINTIEEIGRGETELDLSEEDLVLIEVWLEDYQIWQEDNEKFDRVTSRRHRDASTNASMILVGLPLFLYHWRIIRRETKSIKNF